MCPRGILHYNHKLYTTIGRILGVNSRCYQVIAFIWSFVFNIQEVQIIGAYWSGKIEVGGTVEPLYSGHC